MTDRTPTPTGWSDTDWIKKLQDDEENPLACLHINQGSFDAAADAYEEEYKMSKRTALETSDDWRNDPIKVANCYNTPKYAAILLRRQHAEIERLKADADRVNSCAKNLAIAMHRKNFSNITQWEPLPDTMGLISQIDNMSCWHDAEIDSLKRERHYIYDLLARIHRDGGQYTAENGVEKACEDAEEQVAAWLDTINSVDALIEQARIAKSEACARICEKSLSREEAAYLIRAGSAK